jgi:class 3 adenylate cyclase
MVRAIRELADAIPASPQHAVTEPRSIETAERRQVTVMFSDLVGSTALSARMDPEDLREIISAYQKCVAETVQRFGEMRLLRAAAFGACALGDLPPALDRRRIAAPRLRKRHRGEVRLARWSMGRYNLRGRSVREATGMTH